MTTLCSRPNHRNSRYCAIALALLFALMCATTTTSAQTDFLIAGNQPDLENAYKNELDKWILQAYEGDREAQFKVGVLFTNDQFNIPDYEQAVYWYKQAARQGHVLAQYNLGHQYLTGTGVTKSISTAMRWWLEAARLDHALAQFNVGRAYYLGIGLEEDHTKARYWFNRAAQNKEPKSIEILQQLGWTGSAQSSLTEDTTQPKDPVETAVATPSNDVTPSIIINKEPETIADNTPSAQEELAAQPSNNEPAEATTIIQTDITVEDTQAVTHPITLYTNPEVRSVLISVIEDQTKLQIIEKTGPWTVVSSQQGFPVWVHRDFVSVSDDIGTLTGDAVNARSVPLVISGTIVGKLKRNELVIIVDQQDDWYRIIAPKRFKAWVKTADLKSTQKSSEIPTQLSDDTPTSEIKNPTALITSPIARSSNDNQWLFAQAATNYTLQLGSFDDPAKASTFTDRSKLKNSPDLHQFTSQGDGNDLTYFLYGSFPDNQTAVNARNKIGHKYAWVRTFGRLQQNRCVAWKKRLPAPKELNAYCVE